MWWNCFYGWWDVTASFFLFVYSTFIVMCILTWYPLVINFRSWQNDLVTCIKPVVVFLFSFLDLNWMPSSVVGFEDRFQREAAISSSAIQPCLVKVIAHNHSGSLHNWSGFIQTFSTLCFITGAGIHARKLGKLLGMGGRCHTCQSRVSSESACDKRWLRREWAVNRSSEMLLRNDSTVLLTR